MAPSPNQCRSGNVTKITSGENLQGKLIRPLQHNNRKKQRTLPDNTIHYSTRKFHRSRSYDNTPTPTEQQQ